MESEQKKGRWSVKHRMKVVTLVRGVVPQEKRKEFEWGYQSLKEKSLPDGLEASFLLRKENGSGLYTIQTIWSAKEALEAMRMKERPKAVALFEDLGVTPMVEIHEVVDMVP